MFYKGNQPVESPFLEPNLFVCVCVCNLVSNYLLIKCDMMICILAFYVVHSIFIRDGNAKEKEKKKKIVKDIESELLFSSLSYTALKQRLAF